MSVATYANAARFFFVTDVRDATARACLATFSANAALFSLDIQAVCRAYAVKTCADIFRSSSAVSFGNHGAGFGGSFGSFGDAFADVSAAFGTDAQAGSFAAGFDGRFPRYAVFGSKPSGGSGASGNTNGQWDP